MVSKVNKLSPITLLSLGGGQDSTAILMKYVHDSDFRSRYFSGKLLVVMSDTMDEHAHTYDYLRRVTEPFCKKHGIFYKLIHPSEGYHPRTWQGMVKWMEAKNGLQSVAFPKSCTDNLKVKPIYNFLAKYCEVWLKEQLGIDTTAYRKNSLKEMAKIYGRINVVIGIAYGEDRVADSMPHKWQNQCLNRIYPLIDEKMDRKGCQETISSYNYEVPFPSNCWCCPYMSKQELVWLYRNQRTTYDKLVQLEKNKIEKVRKEGRIPENRNMGVFGKKRIPQVLYEALEKYGYMTDSELNEYKFSHGHCVKSKY